MSKNKPAGRIVDLIIGLEKKVIRPEDLTPRLRKKIVQVFLYERSDVTNRKIAELVGVCEGQVCRIKKGLARAAAWDLDAMDIKEVASNLRIKKTELQTKAVQDRDFALAWRIECEFIEKLMELGFVFRAPERVIVDDLRRAAEDYFVRAGNLTPEQFFELLSRTGGNGKDGPKPIAVIPVTASKVEEPA